MTLTSDTQSMWESKLRRNEIRLGRASLNLEVKSTPPPGRVQTEKGRELNLCITKGEKNVEFLKNPERNGIVMGRHKTSLDGEVKMKPISGGQKLRVSISRQPEESKEGPWTEGPLIQDCIIFIQNVVKGSSQDDGMTIILGKTGGVSVTATGVSSGRRR